MIAEGQQEIQLDKRKSVIAATLKTEKQSEITKMRTFVDGIIAKGKPWTDPDFPPQVKSLFDPVVDKEADAGKFSSYDWKRASDCYANPAVISDGITVSDINQGALGDCYFLAVLSAMAEFPDRIQALIETKTVNAAGIYMLKFFINGIETPVVVDDHLPVIGGSVQPTFAHNKNGELWVALLEKGWAKLHGSYARVESGLPCFANTHLSGVPSVTR